MKQSYENFIQYMPLVQKYKGIISNLTKQLEQTTLTGKVSSLNVARTLFDYMDETCIRFNQLEREMVKNLASENMQKVELEASFKAQALIDTIIRNLYERTADVSFLSTDRYIVEFLISNRNRAGIEERLKDYISKYTVYDDIIIFDKFGNVKAKYDEDNIIVKSDDNIISQVINSSSNFIEIFRPTDIQSHKRVALIYFSKIENPENGEVLGVLALCFRIKLEMIEIYKELKYSIKEAVLALVDKHGNVINSSHERILPFGTNVKISLDEIGVEKYRNETYIVKSAKTKGYHGYSGPSWYGHILIPLKHAFKAVDNSDISITKESIENSVHISNELRKLKTESEDINEDLKDVVLNGEIIASKQHIYFFMPVLDNIRKINDFMNSTFITSIDDIQKTVLLALANDSKALASLCVNLVDRNLYERANDCRWWAMGKRIRTALSKDSLDSSDIDSLNRVLEQVNSLYTLYYNIVVYDKNGIVRASSRDKSLIGTQISGKYISDTLNNLDSQKYFSSAFETSPLYANRATYIYSGTVLGVDSKKVVGGVATIFDGEREFKQILEDIIPKDEVSSSKEAFGLLLTQDGVIVSSTNPEYPVGKVCEIDKKFLSLKAGEGKSDIIKIGKLNYAIGSVASSGYREYGKDESKATKIVAIIFNKI